MYTRLNIFYYDLSIKLIYCAKGVILTHTNTIASCQDGDVRLVGGKSAYEGRVEMCLSRRWSTADAQVVCRQLGYKTQGRYIRIHCDTQWKLQQIKLLLDFKVHSSLQMFACSVEYEYIIYMQK